MFVCGTCKKPFQYIGVPYTSEYCRCSTTLTVVACSGNTTFTGFGEITNNQPIICPGYEALAARTEVPKAFYDAFEED